MIGKLEAIWKDGMGMKLQHFMGRGPEESGDRF